MVLWYLSVVAMLVSVLVYVGVIVATWRLRQQYLQLTEEHRLAYERLKREVKDYLFEEFGLIWDVQQKDGDRE